MLNIKLQYSHAISPTQIFLSARIQLLRNGVHLFYISLFLKFIGYRKQLFIPLLTKPFYQWFFKKLIGSYSFAPTRNKGTATHIPFMEIYRCKVADLAQTYRIEITRDWLTPSYTSLVKSLFYKTNTQSLSLTIEVTRSPSRSV